MCCLCTGRQADYVPDPWTEARKAEVLADLARAAGVPAHRFRWLATGSTATTCITSFTWRSDT
jgi:hypothetical protein